MSDDEAWRSRKQGETNAQWQMRIMQEETDRTRDTGPILTPETERQSEYRDEFVMHTESYTLARTKRNTAKTGFQRLLERNEISTEEYSAALEIGEVVEMIEMAVSVRGASLEARVDNSRGARDLLIERLQQVRMEMAYGEWRDRLPMPRRLYVDMIVNVQPFTATARSYGVPWRMARKNLFVALRLWSKVRDDIAKAIGAREVQAVHYRLGEGVLVGERELEKIEAETCGG